MVEWRGGDQCGGLLNWRDWRWWVSTLWLSTRSTVSLCFFFFFPLGDYVVVVSCGCGCWWWFLKASLCFFFFFSLWWLFLTVVVGGWSGGLSCGFAQIGDGFGV